MHTMLENKFYKNINKIYYIWAATLEFIWFKLDDYVVLLF